MTLTLGNDLTGLVSREIDAAGRRASGLGKSMTTGINEFAPVVDSFLGNSLRDTEIILSTVAKNTGYSVNMLSIANEYMGSISLALQGALTSITSAGQVSADKIPTLQASLNDKIEQVKLLIKTADFDNKALFGGDISDLKVQVALSTTDVISLNIKNLSEGKIFRTSATAAIDSWLIDNGVAGNSAYYNANPGNVPGDIKDNVNLVHTSLTAAANNMTNTELSLAIEGAAVASAAVVTRLGTISPVLQAQLAYGAAYWGDLAAGGGSTVESVLVAGDNNQAAIQIAVRNAIVTGYINGNKKNTIANAVDAAATTAAAGNGAGGQAAIGADVRATFTAAVQGQINLARAGNAAITTALNDSTADEAISAIGNGSVLEELTENLNDNLATSLTTEANRALAHEVINSALTTIRIEQSSISNQKSCVIETTDALRATINVTQEAADSYLKTDYVLTAQEYSETIRTMVAAITSLQAANKIPEAAQRLLEGLAR